MTAATTSESAVVCDLHGEYEQRVLSVGRRNLIAGCPQCAADAGRDRQAKEHEELAGQRKLARIRNSGVPLRFQASTLDGYQADSAGQLKALEVCRRYCERFAELRGLGVCLTLVGKMGTGKTHLACAAGLTLIAQGYSVRYTTVVQMIRSIRSTYQPGSGKSEQDAIAEYQRPDLLILDEVGVQRGTESELLLLTEIIGARYDAVKPTLIIGNCTREDLTANLGQRAVDRLREGGGAFIVCDWDSHRGSLSP